jgi:hypothetical protein
MGGDTNIVEDATHGLPAYSDPEGPVSAFNDLKSYLGLVDGWRETFPTTRAYTYHQIYTGSQSRIDRILVKRDLFEHTIKWDINTVRIKTDHRVVSMKITSEKAPTIGHGRWAWPAHITKDKLFTNFIQEKGLALEANLKAVLARDTRDDSKNAQTLWKDFKDETVAKARGVRRLSCQNWTKILRKPNSS